MPYTGKTGYELFIKPGWKNFLVMVGIWYAGVFVYGLTGNAEFSVWEKFEFYTIYSWLNFALWYVLSIWVIPHFVGKRAWLKMALAMVAVSLLYMVARYYYHIILMPDYYTDHDTAGHSNPTPFWGIFKIEVFRALQFNLFALAYSFIVIFLIEERLRRQLENDNLKAELAALRYQLNPHFLFNSLNNIYYLAIIKSDLTVDAVLKLSDMLRYVLDEKNDMVALQRELDYVNEFIGFHKLRFPDDDVRFEQEVDDNMLIAQVPTLSLLTFIENAFKHSNNDGSRPIMVKLTCQNGHLDYKVNNPIGESTYMDKSSSIGLDNLRRRLGLLMPGRFELSTKQIDHVYHAKLYLHLNSYDSSNSH